MKALKIWGWTLLAASVVLFLYGVFSGEFSQYGLYGTSTTAILLSSFSAVCLLLAVTVLFVLHGLNSRYTKK